MKEIEPITLYFGVKFYSSDPCKLREECTRYQFFLQIKQDIQQSRLPVTNELAAQLLAFIIQCKRFDFLIQSDLNDFVFNVCQLFAKKNRQLSLAIMIQKFINLVMYRNSVGSKINH